MGVYDDKVKKIIKVVVELFVVVGVKYLVLGVGEICNGDLVCCFGNEFFF